MELRWNIFEPLAWLFFQILIGNAVDRDRFCISLLYHVQRDSRETQFYGNGTTGYRVGVLRASINVLHIFLLEHGLACKVGGQ